MEPVSEPADATPVTQESPAPAPAVPPRIERAPTPGLPPRIERERMPGLPPRIERERPVVLPPRIEREPVVGLPPRIERPAPAEIAEPAPAYAPKHAADAPQAPAEPEPELTPDPVAGTAPAAPEPPAYPAAYPPGPSRRPDPVRSPVRAALHSHLWLTGIVLAVLAVSATGYWVLRVHQRIGQATLEHQMAARQHAPTVGCAKLQSDGAAWACAVVYQAESVCLIAKVNVLGSWSTSVGEHRCERIPALTALLPATPTATTVAADVGRQAGNEDYTCDKLSSHKVRWACERPIATGANCLVVRVVQWTSWNVLDGGKTCEHDPDLQKALRRKAAAGT
jgi:hypothetical protein